MATILVVDDEDSIRHLVESVLKREYSVMTAANGLEAVAVFRSNLSAIDLVLTDITMPVMDGVEAVARMRESRPEIPVIVMSGYSESDRSVPAAHFIQKPFVPATILAVVKEALNV